MKRKKIYFKEDCIVDIKDLMKNFNKYKMELRSLLQHEDGSRKCREKGSNLLLVTLIFFVALLQNYKVFAQSNSQPNVLIIMTDQQFADAMSCVMGNQYLHTPNMDRLAENGIRFTRAYSPDPLCKPMRTSMMTGRFPHETGVLTNENIKIDPHKNVFLGKLFKEVGYETAYFGKWHVALDKEQKEVHGFDILTEDPSRLDPNPAAAFLRQKHQKPFFAVASFLSPHEICQWARYEKVPGWPLEELPETDQLPPLKSNFDPPENETDIMEFMRKSHQAHRLFPVGDYTEYDWRRLAWGYYRLIERADEFVGEVTDALAQSGMEENTLVLFLSDNGDCCGSHRWNQKTVFYDESSRVPFIFSWKGVTENAISDILVNTGTDILPTLCAFADIKFPAHLPGKSLKAAVLGKGLPWRREFIVSENHMVQCEPVDGISLQPHGRMVRSDRFKYCLYSEGERRESLVDMKNDPLEMVNLAEDPGYKHALLEQRAYLKQHAMQNNDLAALSMLSEIDAGH